MTENEEDLSLLHSDPSALVLKYQDTIRIIVENYVQSGMFGQGEFEDIVQSVNEGLLQRIPIIARNYNNSASLTTYLSAIIRNICRQLRDGRRLQFQPLGGTDPEDSDASRMFDQLAIEEALGALREVFALYHRDKGRVIILLRIYFKLPLDEKVIRMAYPRSSRKRIRALLEALGGGVGRKNEHELFALAAPFLNKVEKKNTSGDGYRHWLWERIPEILTLLRVRLRASDLDLEALRTLVEAMTLQSGEQK